jgi:linoleoyl-CoA desaturase
MPGNEQLKVSWAAQQMKSTCNFEIKNKALTWLTGGLNFQIEHHLFPAICSIHYPQISKFVSSAAEKYQLPYNVFSTFSSAIQSHCQMLKKLGEIPPAENPYVN